MKIGIKNGIILIFVLITCLVCVLNAIVDNYPPEHKSINCVVDSTWLKPQASVAEPYPLYQFRTNCQITIMLPNKKYNVGDTIIFRTK
jgi:hypothetical protein